ncbi:D-alanyl-D-alanine carboxypeptidase [Streptomyces sp. HNM0575]|nr:D-alanyl-D-alanine carboxypeptidase [Streptomyces sp. HNM0575]
MAAGPFVYTAQAAGPSGVKAKGAFLLDASSGEEMWGKGSDTKREMASTTKVMTAAVVVSSGADLDRKITVKKAYRDYVSKWGGSTADLKTGDKLSLRQLLYGMLLPSGCDAAYALADAVGKGSSTTARADDFIAKMNAKARQLGMKNTEFDSFDGISKKGHNHSTARDMAKLGKYTLGSTNIRNVAKSTSTKQKATNGRTYTWYNTNQLLGSYKGVIGIKTGTGTKAGPCLVFAAERNGHSVVGVILNSGDRYPDAKKMLDWSLEQKTPKLDLRSLPEGAERD